MLEMSFHITNAQTLVHSSIALPSTAIRHALVEHSKAPLRHEIIVYHFARSYLAERRHKAHAFA